MKNGDLRELNIKSVLDAALELFGKYGADKVSFGMIARSAHVTERSVHRYFGSRQELSLAAAKLLVKTRYERVCRVTRTPEYLSMSGLEQIDAILRSYADMLNEDRTSFVTIASIESALVRDGDDGLFEFYFGEKNEFVRHLQLSIEKGRADGSLPDREYDSLSVYTLFVFYRGLLRRIALTYMGPMACNTSLGPAMVERGIEMFKFWLTNGPETPQNI